MENGELCWIYFTLFSFSDKNRVYHKIRDAQKWYAFTYIVYIRISCIHPRTNQVCLAHSCAFLSMHFITIFCRLQLHRHCLLLFITIVSIIWTYCHSSTIRIWKVESRLRSSKLTHNKSRDRTLECPLAVTSPEGDWFPSHHFVNLWDNYERV